MQSHLSHHIICFFTTSLFFCRATIEFCSYYFVVLSSSHIYSFVFVNTMTENQKKRTSSSRKRTGRKKMADEGTYECIYTSLWIFSSPFLPPSIRTITLSTCLYIRASSRRRNEGRSIILRARIGQKCDFWGTLKIVLIVSKQSLGLEAVVYRSQIAEKY